MARSDIFDLPGDDEYYQADAELVQRYKSFSHRIAWLVLAVSLLDLALWAGGMPGPGDFFSGTAGTQPLDSLAFLFLSLLFLLSGRASSAVRLIRTGGACLLALIAVFCVIGRCGSQELLLAFSAAGLVAYDYRLKGRIFPAHYIFAAAMCAGLAILTGHIYGIGSLSAPGPGGHIAAAFAVNFALINLAFLISCPDTGFFRIYLSENFGSFMARRLLPISFILILALGWLYLQGLEMRLFSPAVGMGLLALVAAPLSGFTIWSLARSMNKTDIARKEGEQLVLYANRQFFGINEELDRANALKTEFLHIAAHDLKNPLGRITNYTFLIRDEIDPSSENYEFLDEIEKSSQQMLSLIDQFLEKAEIEDGRVHLEIDELDLTQLARRVSEDMEHLAAAKGQRIFFEGSGGLLVRADYERTQEIAASLIGNAIKFSPFGKNIFVSTGKKEGFACLSVRDEGPGLSGEDMEKAFGKFQTLSAEPTGGENSVGLGLYLSKQLAELQGGRIRIVSEGTGKGAVFILELPLY